MKHYAVTFKFYSSKAYQVCAVSCLPSTWLSLQASRSGLIDGGRHVIYLLFHCVRRKLSWTLDPLSVLSGRQASERNAYMNCCKIPCCAYAECMRPNFALVSAGVTPWVGKGNSVRWCWLGPGSLRGASLDSRVSLTIQNNSCRFAQLSVSKVSKAGPIIVRKIKCYILKCSVTEKG